MIQIVIRNILNNSIKFCNEGCEITISAAFKSNHQMMICIEDNGQGMSAEALEMVNSGTGVSTRGTKDEKGTGLGLVICRDFMERNNGTMEVYSAPNRGTTFKLYLPTDEQNYIIED